MTQKHDDQRPFDPFAAWQSMRDASVDAWAKMMLQMVNSEEYAKAMSAIMDSYLTTSAPFRKVVEAMMVQFVSSEEYAKATRDLLDTYMTTSGPFREALQATMLQALTQFNAPSSSDLTSMAERFDPTGLWRNMRDTGMSTWSSMISAAPFQQTLEATMAQVLTQFNMPTRTDVTSLAERLAQLETRLDRIESKIDKEG